MTQNLYADAILLQLTLSIWHRNVAYHADTILLQLTLSTPALFLGSQLKCLHMCQVTWSLNLKVHQNTFPEVHQRAQHWSRWTRHDGACKASDRSTQGLSTKFEEEMHRFDSISNYATSSISMNRSNEFTEQEIPVVSTSVCQVCSGKIHKLTVLKTVIHANAMCQAKKSTIMQNVQQ